MILVCSQQFYLFIEKCLSLWPEINYDIPTLVFVVTVQPTNVFIGRVPKGIGGTKSVPLYKSTKCILDYCARRAEMELMSRRPTNLFS